MIQCYRCQRFGHSSTNCGMTPRCVKCLLSHESGKCFLPKYTSLKESERIEGQDEVKSPKASCVNCGNVSHPASWRGCPTHLMIKQRRTENILRLQAQQEVLEKQKQELYNNFRVPRLSYAEKAKQFPALPKETRKTTRNFPFNNDATHTRLDSPQLMEPEVILEEVSKTNAFTFINGECQQLMGCSLFLLIKKVKEFLPTYKTIVNIEDRQASLISFAMALSDIPQWLKTPCLYQMLKLLY